MENLRRARLMRGTPTQREQRAESKQRTAEQRERIRSELEAMMAQGLSYRQMSARLGIALSAAHRHCQKLKQP